MPMRNLLYYSSIKKMIMASNNQPPREGNVATMLEEQTAKIPSDIYLWTAVGTMALSLALFLGRNKHASLFFGQWAPSLLIIGLYNKLVKVQGHDQENRDQQQGSEQMSTSASRVYERFE
jgi:hypothetical protein